MCSDQDYVTLKIADTHYHGGQYWKDIGQRWSACPPRWQNCYNAR